MPFHSRDVSVSFIGHAFAFVIHFLSAPFVNVTIDNVQICVTFFIRVEAQEILIFHLACNLGEGTI